MYLTAFRVHCGVHGIHRNFLRHCLFKNRLQRIKVSANHCNGIYVLSDKLGNDFNFLFRCRLVSPTVYSFYSKPVTGCLVSVKHQKEYGVRCCLGYKCIYPFLPIFCLCPSFQCRCSGRIFSSLGCLRNSRCFFAIFLLPGAASGQAPQYHSCREHK